MQRVETTSKIILSENDNNQTLINGSGVANHPGHTLPLLSTVDYHFAIVPSHQQLLCCCCCCDAAQDERPMTEKNAKRNNEKKYRNIITSGQCSSSPLIQYGRNYNLRISFLLNFYLYTHTHTQVSMYHTVGTR